MVDLADIMHDLLPDLFDAPMAAVDATEIISQALNNGWSEETAIQWVAWAIKPHHHADPGEAAYAASGFIQAVSGMSQSKD